MSELAGPAPWLARLEEAGLRSAADVLARARCVRDLPERSNHELVVGDTRLFVKRRKGGHRAREAEALGEVAALGVPVADLAFFAVDARLGALTATCDLAPAAPLDDLLCAGTPTRAQRRDALARLARAVAALHEGRRHHRDLYLNHVFAAPRGRRCPVRIIDWERLGGHRRPLGRRVLKDLAALAASLPDGTVPLRERARFLLLYLRARGLPRRALYRDLVRRIRRKAQRIRRHVPRTPVGAAARPGAEPT